MSIYKLHHPQVDMNMADEYVSIYNFLQKCYIKAIKDDKEKERTPVTVFTGQPGIGKPYYCRSPLFNQLLTFTLA